MRDCGTWPVSSSPSTLHVGKLHAVVSVVQPRTCMHTRRPPDNWQSVPSTSHLLPALLRHCMDNLLDMLVVRTRGWHGCATQQRRGSCLLGSASFSHESFLLPAPQYWRGLRYRDPNIVRTVVLILWVCFEPVRLTAGWYGNAQENVSGGSVGRLTCSGQRRRQKRSRKHMLGTTEPWQRENGMPSWVCMIFVCIALRCVRTCLNVGPCHVVPRSCHGSCCSSSSALRPSTSPCSTSCSAARCGCILTTTSNSRCLTHFTTALRDWHLLAPPDRFWWEGMRQSTQVGRSFHIGRHVTFPVVACAGWRPPGDSCAVFTSDHHSGRLLWWHLRLRPDGKAAKAAGEQLASFASAVLQTIGLWCLLANRKPEGAPHCPPPLGQHALPPIHLQTVGARPSSCNPYHCICMCCCTQYYLFEYVMNQRRRNAAYRVNAQTQGGIGSKRKS